MESALILIGGFGFVGRNILETVQGAPEFHGFQPVVVDDLSNACPGHENIAVPKYIGAYQSGEAAAFLEQLNAKNRTIVFLAGETRVAESKDRPHDFITANITEPAHFVTSVIQPGDHFILVSTAGALFDGTFEVRVDSPYCPKNFYGATKAAEEMILEKLVKQQKGAFSVVRMTNVYGRFSEKKKSAIHAFTRAIIAGETVTINGDGRQMRDFIFASDVGRGIATLADRVRRGETVHSFNMLGSGESVSLMEVVRTIEDVAGSSLRRKQIAAEELIATEPRDVIVSKEDVKVLLGANITPFREGIRKTWEYYAEK
jgi:UDP-glucose 4-epimerase